MTHRETPGADATLSAPDGAEMANTPLVGVASTLNV